MSKEVDKWGWRSLLRRFWVAVFVGFLFMKSTAGIFWTAENRFFYHWSRTDAAGVLLAICVVGTLFFAAYTILERCGRWGRFAGQFFFVAVALFYLKVNVGELIESFIKIESVVPKVSLALKCLVGITLIVFLFRRRKVVRAVTTLCMVLSPILPIYAWTLLSARGYVPNMEAEPKIHLETLANVNVGRVCVFIMDEWSYKRVFEDRQVLTMFPETDRAASQAIVFHEAYSPAACTLDSIPSMLCGVSGKGIVVDGVFRMDVGKEFLVPDESDHIFKQFKSMGYRTLLCGNYIPYPELFRTGVDSCKSENLYKVLGTGPLAVSAALLLENAKIRLAGIHPVMGYPFHVVKHRYFARFAEWTQDLALAGIAGTEPSFMVFHYPVPHMPFMFDREGPARSPGRPVTLDLEDYTGNLRYTDTLIGEILDAVASSPFAGKTLLVFTSDHSFRFDPDSGEGEAGELEKRHVPFIVCLPGQTGRMDNDLPFNTVHMKDVLGQYMETDLSPDSFLRLCSQSKWEGNEDD